MKKLTLGFLALFVIAACSDRAPASITGQWKLVSYGPMASQTPAAPDVDTFIEFKSGGLLSGNVGCNGFGGDYNVEGDSIAFVSIVSTMMFCEGPVGDQESATLAVIQESAKFVLEGDRLSITSADGNIMIILSRK